MLRPWNKHEGFEARLRAHRAEPRDDFFDDLVRRATPNSARTRYRRSALAVALTVVLLGALASLGGVSYASFKAPVTVVKKLAVQTSAPQRVISHSNGDTHPSSVTRKEDDGRDGRDWDRRGDDWRKHLTSGHGQYGFTICHRPPGNPGNEHTITVGSIAAVFAHLRHGDHLGPC